MSVTTQQSEAPSGDSFLTMKQVTELTRYSRPSIYRLIKHAGFPYPLKMAPAGKVLFPAMEVRAWLSDRPRASLA
jgi:predicted DNA-binding transcriptional regulator AlpA